MFQMLDKVDRKLRERLEKVTLKAAEFGDNGVVQWAARAAEDAQALGRVRDRDVKALERLEGTYNGEFYRSNSGVYA
jgi:hypothetical protein